MRTPRKEIKRKISKVKRYYIEWKEENNSSINFKDWFITVLQYTEDDLKYFAKPKVKKEKKFNPNKTIPYGRGDIENPEYDKYFLLYNDYYKHYLFTAIPKEQKTLKTYFKVKYNYSDDKALEEARKIQNIVFAKKRKNIDNKLIIKELDNKEYRIIGKV